MIDWQTLYLIVLGIYVLDTVLWVPRGAALFYRPWRARWRIRSGGWPVEAINKEAAWSPLLPPFGRVMVSPAPAIRYGRQGYWTFSRPLDSPGGECYRAYSEPHQLTLTDCSITRSGTAIAIFHSAGTARYHFELLSRLLKATESARGAIVEEDLRRQRDVRVLARVLQEAAERGSGLHWACITQFCLLIILFPLYAFQFGFDLVWLPLLVIVLANDAWIARRFTRVRRSLEAPQFAKLPGAAATFLLSPVSAIRAYDEIIHRVAENYDRFAAAALLMDDLTFREAAGAEYRAVVLASPPGEISERECADLLWLRASRHQWLEKLLRERRIDPACALAPPGRQCAQSAAYCPRCHAQFVSADLRCAACELPVTPFPAN